MMRKRKWSRRRRRKRRSRNRMMRRRRRKRRGCGRIKGGRVEGGSRGERGGGV